jgi:uncharacterized phiE125 gp8 family phage protein
MADNIEGSLELISRHVDESSGRVIWPVSVDELKAQSQVTHDLDDELLLRLIADATEEIESRGQVALISQVRRLVLDRLPVDEAIWLPRYPVASPGDVVVRYLDANDIEQVLPSSLYSVRSMGRRPTIYFRLSSVNVADGPGICSITMHCGYGDAASSVPAQWRQLVLAVATHRYERREMVSGGGIDEAFENVIERKVIAAGGSRRYV